MANNKSLTAPAKALVEVQRTVQALQTVEEDLERLEGYKAQFRAEIAQYIRKTGQPVKLPNGSKYLLVQRANLVIKKGKDGAAEKWFRESPETRMKPDSSAALNAMKQDSKLTKIFSRSITEFVQLKKPSLKRETEDHEE